MTAIHDFERGEAAGRGGHALVSDASPQFAQGWARGDTERRVQAGEVIGFVCPATRCSKCGSTAWGHRAGCGCWPMDAEHNPFTMAGCERLKEDGYVIEWGLLVVKIGETRDSVFMSSEELLAEMKAGKPLVDCFTGKPVPV
jgi:hypothetical protein